MNYNDALEYIHSSPKISKKIGNESLKKVLKKLGSPEQKLDFVHIAGTNGKGSVSAMVSSVLCTANYKTGLFISPYIERFNERISVNNVNISDEELARITDYVKSLLEKMEIELSEFALIFVISLIYFAEQSCEVVVLETGLGGRLDATNAIDKSLVSAITSIGLDHTQYLGNTIEEIAKEKAGIIKKNGKVVLYHSPHKNVLEIFRRKCSEMNASLAICDLPVVFDDKLIYGSDEYILSLKGDYQYSNGAVCLEIIEKLRDEGFSISKESVKKGLSSTIWPGRFEWLSPHLLIDGCHNVDGVREFGKSLAKYNEPVTIITGVMSDKDYRSIAEELSKITKNIIITEPDVPRALSSSDYESVFNSFGIYPVVISDVRCAVDEGLKSGGICAVCGSLYLIGEVRSIFGHNK